MVKTEEKSNKIMTIIGSILCVILVPILIVNCTLIAKSVLNKDEVPSVGGYMPLIVLTDSMYPTIESGDLIICHTEDAKNIKEGDIISFFDPDGNGTSIVTHRVLEVTTQDGQIAFKTKGDGNNVEDQMLVPADKLVSVYQMRIAGAGNVAMFMQTTPGLVCCVGLPLALILGYDFLRRSKYEKEQKKDTDALLAELERLKAEKAANESK